MQYLNLFIQPISNTVVFPYSSLQLYDVDCYIQLLHSQYIGLVSQINGSQPDVQTISQYSQYGTLVHVTTKQDESSNFCNAFAFARFRINSFCQLSPFLIANPFKYELINKIKDEYIFAFAFNKEATLLVAGYESSKIRVFEFEQGQLRQLQELSNHSKRVRCVYFLQKSPSFISGSYDRSIIVWEASENRQFYCKQQLEGHTDDINCLIINNNEDLIISGSDDKTIRLWSKNVQWHCSQTLTYHNGSVFCISMNETQNQFISCAADNLIVVSQKDVNSSFWNILQTIKVEWGLRLCFISNTQFTYQPYNKKQMIIYEQSKFSQQFVKQKEIAVKSGNDCFWYFPQKYIKSKSLLLNKNGSSLNLIKIKENGEFIQEQIIDFDDNYIHGAISDDGEYLITWDCKTEEIQVRQYSE
ncbi:unnamed protein product [Paramecium octaurelia]|uniref:Uncharacterized protein n=1 Tax=Paramecium octaurelia TaxID=43137 RepID=A0A8S1YGT0_PAROT|nr:unnamed protein product [Paramecium octaurelia]